MSMAARFSERHGFSAAMPAEITVRHDAPRDLRGIVAGIAYEAGMSPSPLRGLICRLLRKREDPGNWSEWPNIASEVEGLLDDCQWFEVYDIIEAIHERLLRSGEPVRDDHAGELGADYFSRELNSYFRKQGIGWQLVHGQVTVRGPEIFEEAVHSAGRALEASDRTTARQELHEALRDLSRRPEPDRTGAIQHAMAALECVMRDVTGDASATLGECLRRNPGVLPPPLDQAVEKAWGYASERGRHLREGREPDLEDAELIVGLAGLVTTYLIQKLPK